MKAVLGKQLMITVDNKVGTLAEVAGVVSSQGINLNAVCAYAIDNKGFILFVTADMKCVFNPTNVPGFEIIILPC